MILIRCVTQSGCICVHLCAIAMHVVLQVRVRLAGKQPRSSASFKSKAKFVRPVKRAH